MKLNVRVKTNTKRIKVEGVDDGLIVHLTVRPEKGKANKQLINVLSDYFGVSKSKIFIDKGGKSKSKRVIIDE